jgi:hypothetical protein
MQTAFCCEDLEQSLIVVGMQHGPATIFSFGKWFASFLQN